MGGIMNKKILIIGIVTLLIDQITKIIIDLALKIDETVSVIKNFFYITRVSNTGAAFSILEGKTILLSIVSVIAVILLLRYMKDFKNNKLVNLSFGLLLGGIIGNFGDRLFLGYVRDFLKFNIFGYNYPVFNIADATIVIGVILLIICMIRGDEISGNSSKHWWRNQTR